MFALGISPQLNFDLYPNPDFSLVALGFDRNEKRLDVHDAPAVYRKEQNEAAIKEAEKEGWVGMSSEEGWKVWLGPFAFSENKLIVAQEPAP